MERKDRPGCDRIRENRVVQIAFLETGKAEPAAFAIPLDIFGLNCFTPPLIVTHAGGHERYVTFAGEKERPEPDKVIFGDAEA